MKIYKSKIDLFPDSEEWIEEQMKVRERDFNKVTQKLETYNEIKKLQEYVYKA